MQTTTTPIHLRNRPQAAAYLNISQRKLDQLTANGELRRVKVGASVRYDPSDLNAFVESRKSA